jgi:hypothetical protein
MAAVIYALCAATSLVAAALLWREYSRTRFRILFWSALCFAFLTLNNVLLVLDRFVYTDIDLTLFRLTAASTAMLLLLFGLIWESE